MIEPMTDADLASWDQDANIAENESAFMYLEVQDYRKLRERLRIAEEASNRWESLVNLAKDHMAHSVKCRSVQDYRNRMDSLRSCDCGVAEWFASCRGDAR